MRYIFFNIISYHKQEELFRHFFAIFGGTFFGTILSFSARFSALFCHFRHVFRHYYCCFRHYFLCFRHLFKLFGTFTSTPTSEFQIFLSCFRKMIRKNDEISKVWLGIFNLFFMLRKCDQILSQNT